jgi:hypothetical protein
VTATRGIVDGEPATIGNFGYGGGWAADVTRHQQKQQKQDASGNILDPVSQAAKFPWYCKADSTAGEQPASDLVLEAGLHSCQLLAASRPHGGGNRDQGFCDEHLLGPRKPLERKTTTSTGLLPRPMRTWWRQT